jgi:hypothetical protein
MKFSAGILVIIAIPLLMANCDKAVSIEDLKKDMFSYDELPDSVKVLFVNAKQYAAVSGTSSLLYSDSSLRYTFEASKSIGSFIDYYEITDENSKKKIRIPYGKILPFVIYDNMLYIPTVYNVQNNLLKAEQSRYEGYHLR